MIMCSSQELLAQLGMCNLQTDLAHVGPRFVAYSQRCRIFGTAQAIPPQKIGGSDGPLRQRWILDGSLDTGSLHDMREKLQLWCPPGFIQYNCITVYSLDIDFFRAKLRILNCTFNYDGDCILALWLEYVLSFCLIFLTRNLSILLVQCSEVARFGLHQAGFLTESVSGIITGSKDNTCRVWRDATLTMEDQ